MRIIADVDAIEAMEEAGDRASDLSIGAVGEGAFAESTNVNRDDNIGGPRGR